MKNKIIKFILTTFVCFSSTNITVFAEESPIQISPEINEIEDIKTNLKHISNDIFTDFYQKKLEITEIFKYPNKINQLLSQDLQSEELKEHTNQELFYIEKKKYI